MTRRKVQEAERLIHKIGLRVSDPFYKKMEGWLAQSNCQTIAELARLILYKEEIIWYHKDTSLDNTTVELTAIRKELNAIGSNINQVTRYFNGTTIPSQKIFEALKILDEYKKVNEKVERLLLVISELTKNGGQGD
jgi:hypothetical protein